MARVKIRLSPSLARPAVLTLLGVAALSALSAMSGCAGGSSSSGSGHDDEPAESLVGQVESALVPSDPVSKAVSDSCTTSAVKGLGEQLVAEIQCLRPGTMERIDDVPNTTLGSAVFPYMQTPAADALRKVVKTRTVKLVINSALRTLPQQYLLYRWYKTGRCGIGLAATPGTSNHESGVAVDVNDNAGWRTGFQSNGFRWLGASDPVHYDYTAGGVNIRGLSVKAFQRLWNRNNPNDKIDEDGAYGPATETRLAKSPIGGFPIGGSCPDGGVKDAGVDVDGGALGPDTPNEAPETPDAPEPDAIPDQPGSGLAPIDESQGGCAAAPGPSSGSAGLAATSILFGLGIAASRARRKGRATSGGK